MGLAKQYLWRKFEFVNTRSDARVQAPPFDVHDIAAYLFLRSGACSPERMQLLIYYTQAWSLVLDGRPLFPEPIEAWPDGPVCPAFHSRQGAPLTIKGISGAAQRLDPPGRRTIDDVIDRYGDKTSDLLRQCVKSEDPWRDARCTVRSADSGQPEISHASLSRYYGNIQRQAEGEARRAQERSPAKVPDGAAGRPVPLKLVQENR